MIHFIMHCIQINKKNKNFELIFSTYNTFFISKMLFNNIIIICKNNSEVRNVKLFQFFSVRQYQCSKAYNSLTACNVNVVK